MLRGAVNAIKNRLPGGIEYISLCQSRKIYKNNKDVDFYKIQFFHNLKAYFLISLRYSPMKYEAAQNVPSVMFHISDAENTQSILSKGLISKHNPVVFLSSSKSYIDFLKAESSKNGFSVFKIDSERMANDGFEFFNDRQKSRSIIWVTKAVPPEYIEKVDSV